MTRISIDFPDLLNYARRLLKEFRDLKVCKMHPAKVTRLRGAWGKIYTIGGKVQTHSIFLSILRQ